MPKTVLIVEDNELNRDVLSRRLRRRGYHTTIALNGADAIEKVTCAEPDLVLMDMSLPGIDGWEATSRLRSQGLTLPIIALTAHATSADRKRCLGVGCDDFASKPVDLPILLNIMERLLGAEPVVE